MVDFTNFPDNFEFSISKNQLRTRTKFDFEKKNKYLIKIRTTDFGGLIYEAIFEIQVNDLQEITFLKMQKYIFFNFVKFVLNIINPSFPFFFSLKENIFNVIQIKDSSFSLLWVLKYSTSGEKLYLVRLLVMIWFIRPYQKYHILLQ